jgi:hypothetical protein
MTVRNAFFNGLRVGMRQWRITAIVYLLQLCLALTVGMQVYDVLQASIGQSLEIKKLLYQYDHTVITDFLKVHGSSIAPLIGQTRWLLLAWLLFSVFMDGGLLYCSTLSTKISGKSFWQGGAIYFIPFLKFALFFLALALVWTGLIFVPLMTNLQSMLQEFYSEKHVVWLVFLLLIVWLTGLALLFVWSVLSRLYRINTEFSIFNSIKNGARTFRQKFWRLILLCACFFGIQLSLIGIYWMVAGTIGMVTALSILMLVVIQQAFVFIRIQLRQMMYAAIGAFV